MIEGSISLLIVLYMQSSKLLGEACVNIYIDCIDENQNTEEKIRRFLDTVMRT